jgi:hypothetical protein
MTQVTREIVAMYQVDGVFSNRWSGSGMCYCEHCTRNFKAAAGLDLPRTGDPRNPSRRAYIEWHQQRLFELWDVWDKAIREANPKARFVANSGGGALSELNMRTIGEKASILFADRQARSGLTPSWANGKNGKEYRAALGNKPIGGIFSVGVEEQYRWKDSVQSAPEIRLWALDGIANGLRPWFTKFGGVLRDKRWLPVVEDVYTWHWRNERYLRNTAPLARVGMVYSQQTAHYYGGERARAKVEDHTLGFYQALIEARIPFEMVHDEKLDAEQLAALRVLILPNIAAMSERQCGKIRDFVRRGGGVVATFETSLYDERGERRENFGLSDLFGASYAGGVDARMMNSYLRLETRHPLLSGLENAERIINGVARVRTKPSVPYPNPPLTLIPSYPDLPMEEVFPREDHTGQPEAYVRETGGGRAVYFPWDIDRTFWEVLSVDHGKLLRNAVDWATNEPRPVTVTGPGVLDVTVWRQQDSVTVHMVNLSNSMMMKGPLREFIPLPAQEVALRLPEGKKPRGVKLLVAGGTPRVREAGGEIRVTVPSVLDHEVIAVDL